jgi:3alpha(or 20beta)-hydroxysteroid dehydrogenase
MGKLDGKVAIVTGGAQGIGGGIAEIFIQEGAKVIVADISEATGKAQAEKLGEKAFYMKLDVCDEKNWGQLAQAVFDTHGKIDILVNNAAIYFYALIEEAKTEDVRRLLDINSMGPYLGMKAVIPFMKKKLYGSIINISSTDGLRGSCGMGAYNASKWALRGLTKCIAMEAGPFGIRVNSLHPGATDTPMNNPDGIPHEQLNEELMARMAGIALNRISRPVEVGRAAAFLASDEASYISGAELAHDGGWTCGVYLLDKPSP